MEVEFEIFCFDLDALEGVRISLLSIYFAWLCGGVDSVYFLVLWAVTFCIGLTQSLWVGSM